MCLGPEDYVTDRESMYTYKENKEICNNDDEDNDT